MPHSDIDVLSTPAHLRRLQYHQVSHETADKMAKLRACYYALGVRICEMLPDNRECTLSLTALEESCMRAIQCLALTEGTPIDIGAVSS